MTEPSGDPAGITDPRLTMAADGEAYRYLTVHEAMGLILKELPAIGKNQQAPAAIGGYAFRGIEDVLLELNPLLSKYGVFVVPDVQSISHLPDRGKEHVSIVVVRYTFWGPGGDSVVAGGVGEGSDTRDKGIQKAMTSAFKYVLFQTFAISTEEAAQFDVDRNVTDESPPDAPPPPPQATERQIIAILDRLRPLLGEDDEGKLVYPEEWRAARADSGQVGTLALQTMEAMVTGDRPYCSEPYATKMNEVLDQIGGTETRKPATDDPVGSEPCSLCGRTRTDRVIVEGQVRCSNATACRKHVQERQGDSAAAHDGAAAALGSEEPNQ